MARFKDRNLRLDDTEDIIFGTSANNSIGYKPSAGKVMVSDNIGVSAYPPVAPEDFVPKKYVDDEITDAQYELGDYTFEPLGFVNYWNNSVMTFDNLTRTFTIAPTGYPGGNYKLLLHGRKFVETKQKSVQISDVEGLHFIYFELLTTPSLSANLVSSTTPWNLCEHALTAIVHWDVTNQEAILFGEERHGVTMDCSTHDYLHHTVNTRFRSGLTLTTVASGTPSGFDGSLDSQAEVDITDGQLSDEDILISIVNSATPTGKWEQKLSPISYLPIYYRTGILGYWRKSKADQFPCLWSGSDATSASAFTLPAWNDPASSFTLTEVTSGYYFATWVMGTNDVDNPVAILCGQREDSTFQAAEAGNALASYAFGTFPFTEFKMLYRIIWQASNAYGNNPKAVIRDIEDYRTVASLPTGQPIVQVHGSLDGRSEPGQHPASAISVDTTSWTGNLSAGGVADVQDALDIFDLYIPPQGGLQIIPPTTDLTANGITTTVTVSANDTGFGATLYRDTDAFYEADASDISTMPCHCLALEIGTGLKEVLMFGYIRDDSWSWTPGADIYVDTDAGELTETQPSVSGDIVQVIGWAFDTNIIFFDRDKTTTEVL